MARIQRILKRSLNNPALHAITRQDARFVKQLFLRNSAVEPRLEQLAHEQPEVYAPGYVALYDHLIAIRREESESLSLSSMHAKRDKVTLLHPQLAHQQGLKVGSILVRKTLRKTVLSQLQWWGNNAGGMFAASLWYDWPSWVRWAQTGGGNNASVLLVADKIVVFLLLLWLVELALRHVPGAVLSSVPDSYGQVMTVRRWLIYRHYVRSPALEWLTVIVYIVLNVLNIMFVGFTATAVIPDPAKAIVTVVRITLAVWSSFRLAVRAYGWSVRNHKLLSMPNLVSPRHGSILVAAGVAFVAWDYIYDFSVLDQARANGLNTIESVINTFLAPHYKSAGEAMSMSESAGGH